MDGVRERRLILLAIGALGVSAVVTQLALMRELLGAFAGNELVLGLVLGNWLLLTGLGASLGRRAPRLRRPLDFLTGSSIGIAIIPLMQLVAVRTLRDVVFGRGALVGVLETGLASAVVLAPFCLLSGFMLTLACSVLAAPKDIGRVYVADSLGSIAGGVVFSFGLVLVCDHFGALIVPAALNLVVAVALAWQFGNRLLLAVAGVLLVGLGFTGQMDAHTTTLQHRGQQVVFRGNSPYGRLVITESAGQRNFIENGVPLFSTHNVAQVEETVHYAMAQRPGARRVLLLGGGVTGTARELLKYAGVAVTYVELDPLILRVAGNAMADPRIYVAAGDGRRFLQRTTDRFDVIIVDVPEPSTLQLNRFFTAEFFAEAKRALAPGGVVAFPLGRYENYVGPELTRLLATANATVRESFHQTLLIPGGRVFFLASDGELTTDIAARVPVGTTWVNRHYLDAQLTPDRLADLRRAAAAPATVNRDFEPVLFRHYLRHWLSQFSLRLGVPVGILGLALVVYVVRLRASALVVFAGGFAASVLEVLLLLAFQVAYGSVYRGLGVIVTVFMGGLAAGAWWASRQECRSHTSLAWLALGIAGLAAVLPWAMRVGWLIGPLTFGLAVLVGMEFPVASRGGTAATATTAGRLYAADFVGASVGALVASAWLIPLVGVAATCWLVAGLNVAAAVVMRCAGRETTS